MTATSAPRRATTATTRPTPRGRWYSRAPRARWVWLGVDASATLALLALIALAFQPVYGNGWLWVSVIGCGVVGVVIGWLAARGHWRVGITALVSLAAWFGLGGALMTPSSTLVGLPTARSLQLLATTPVTGWKGMLTIIPPIGEAYGLLTIPGLIALLVGVVTMAISLRNRRPALAWLPSAVALCIAFGLGVSVNVLPPFWVAAGFFVITLCWSSYRRSVERGALMVNHRFQVTPAALGAGVLVVALAAVFALQSALVQDAPRATAREAVRAPIDVEQYASPLQGFRLNVTKNKSALLFRTTGLSKGAIIRLATLDRYDGTHFAVSNTDDAQAWAFTRVGDRIVDDAHGAEVDATVTIQAYEGVWVPTVGHTTQVTFTSERKVGLADTFYFNRRTGTGLTTLGLAEADAYTLHAVVPERPSNEVIGAAHGGSYWLPEWTGVPDALKETAQRWGGAAATKGEAALALERELRAGWFSNGGEGEAASLPGHTTERLTRLIARPEVMVGDSEQYATAMAIMARELGIPARVIYGYKVGDSGDIQGKNVGAWPELYFEELGWVMFEPTPPETRKLDEEDPPKPPVPRPHVENPPPPPQKPENPPPDNSLPVEPSEPQEPERQINWAAIGAWAAITGIPLLTIVAPIVLILGLKYRRARTRRNNPVLANRVAGAWAELVDHARDLGRSPSPSATRSEQAAAFKRDFERLPQSADAIELARDADACVFAPDEVTQSSVESYWSKTQHAVTGMRKSVRWRRWLRGRLSTKSFRRYR